MHSDLGITYAAIACFGIEYITLFMGVTCFFRPLQAFNTVMHIAGFVLQVIFYHYVSAAGVSGIAVLHSL